MNVKLIEKFIEENKKLVIAIDGPSGSGKSTLSSLLEEKYNVLVFHTDDYFLHPSRKTNERLNEPGGNLDYERMQNEIFENLENETIISNHFNCMTNELEYRQAFIRKNIILIEGVYSMHPKFIEYYDLKIFLNVSRETQHKRILQRSNDFMLSRFIKEWIPLEDLYFDTFQIKKLADIVIENE